MRQETETLMDQLEKLNTGMLGVQGDAPVMQPMTHFVDRDARILWFITSRQSELAAQVGTGRTALYTLTAPGQDFHACMSGPITQSSDRAKLEQLWSPIVGAWFDKGFEDPDVVLLMMPLARADTWNSTNSALRLGFEIVKANLTTGEKPDLGEHHSFDIKTAA